MNLTTTSKGRFAITRQTFFAALMAAFAGWTV